MGCVAEACNKGSITFSSELDSNTGKMKKAREKGIEIRLY